MKRLLSIVISALILAVIYWRIDLRAMLDRFRECDPLWLVVSLAMVVPITLATARRLQQLMPVNTRLGFGEANGLILVASVLNMVLPSKMGDLAKAWFMGQRGHMRSSLALSLVVFEKSCDMLSLLAWCVLGLMLYPRKDAMFWTMTAAVSGGFLGLLVLMGSRRFAQLFMGQAARLPGKLGAGFTKLSVAWEEMHGHFWSDKRQLARVALTSLFIWFLHLLQIWLFIIALGGGVSLLTNLALAPLAILAGLLPLTFAGVGTRDAALVYFFKDYLSPATAAALGVLCTMRYLLPALAGLPLLRRYMPDRGALAQVKAPF